MPDPETTRGEMVERWEGAAAGWSKRADRVREMGMPVAAWMIEQVHLQPGHTVLELAAGPGDTGFLAAELIRPGGTLISSDAAEAMLEVARGRARQLGVENVEFKQLQLEWIDMPTANVDAILCRFALMLLVDPGAALHEMRRVLRPHGRLALAVWDRADQNPWATIPNRALVQLGHAAPPVPNEPGMFALSDEGRLEELLDSAGFTEVVVETVGIERAFGGVDEFIEETRDLSRLYSQATASLSEEQLSEVHELITALAEPFLATDGSLRLHGRTLVAAASA